MAATETRSRVAPDKVFETLRKSILVDGFHLVLDLEKSRGSTMVDARDGKEYLDFYTYFATLPIGHNHPKMADSVFREKLLRASLANPANSDVYTVELAEFVETFQRVAQRGFPYVFFIAGGALAVENALKAAFDWRARKNLSSGTRGEHGPKVIHLREAFHGRSGYTMSLTNTDKVKTEHFPKFDWPRIENPKCAFPMDAANLEETKASEDRALHQIDEAVRKFGDGIAALIIEPIQGEGGDNHFRAEFLRALRKLADAHGFLLIYDEVQTGVGSTGKFWCYEHFEGAEPDLVSFGKKMQVCGVLGGKRLDEVRDHVFKMSGRINSTWGGNLADMVRAQRYLEIIEEENLVENARLRGETLVAGLRDLESRNALVSNARGRGLFCAFDLPDTDRRNAAWMKAIEQGVFALKCGQRSIRFRPALTVTDAEIGRGIDMLERAIRKLA